MGARDDKLKERLARAGVGHDVAEAALDIDAILQSWRRRFTKRELGLRALGDLGLDIEMAELDVLIAVRAPVNEFGEGSGEETMVSTVASRLAIDPSRASRLTSQLIKRGLLRRAVSQQDARRAVLELTEAGERAVEAVRSYKFLVLGSYLKDWTMEEIQTFLPLLERFSAWSEKAACPTGPVEDEVAKLRAALAEDLKNG
ncbi:winged helix DNA-binding protein [Mameliella alba]|nr:winged helix DNA-binding protein [Mameliella sediminis]MBY6112992.1 winged helix DNA-binding protein [Antarctobacter heliothermus]MBY6143660.1 winged helix DNA-binding protein [Mameliella alba]MBY6162314.1 winged helix DNA-binding protein [Mameliella alba]MBY6170788.1 winged helix DNA-binding protein [Mameliella alba]